MERIKEIVKAFEQPGSFLSSAMVKKNRHKEVTIVCQPQYFAGAQFLERDTQMEMLDGLLYHPKNAKQKRNLIVAVASSGMGKSAFVDEYCRRRSSETDLNCIAISFNTKAFGGSLEGSAVIDLAARLLMSYFLSNPSTFFLAIIYNELRKKKYRKTFGTDIGVLKAAVEYIKMDLRELKGYDDATKPKILIACDEVGKSDKEKKVVALLLTELVDEDDDLECFFTGLSLNPFLKETASGRDIVYVPLPLLNFTSSLRLVQSFLNESGSFNVSSILARLSGGHPRTIQIFETIAATNKWNAEQWTDSMVQTVVESALPRCRTLSGSDIMLLLRPRTLLTDIKRNADLIEALGEGRIYATISSDKMYVDLFTSPLMLRNALLSWDNVEKTNNSESMILNEMLKLVGLRDLREFGTANADKNGKIFEDFFLNMEMLRRGFRFSKLELQRVQSFAEFYPTVRYSQNCDDFKFELVDKYKVVDIDCQRDFPSRNPVDAAVVKRVKSLIGGSSAKSSVFRPSNKENQVGYDFFFILKDLSTGTRYVQLIEPTLSAGGATPDAFFIERYVKKLKAVQSLAWVELGIDAENIVHTFVSTGDTSRIDWATVFKSAGYSDSRILILDRADLKAFLGPMLDVLFSCGFDDDN